MFSLLVIIPSLLLSACLVALLLWIGHVLQQKISFLHDPVYVPSKDEAIERMWKLSGLEDAAGAKKRVKVIDFGSGDGRVVIEFAQRGCIATGYEIHLLLVQSSRRKIKELDLEWRAKIKMESFWNADVREADVVLLYTTASIMERLEKKLFTELKPGAKVVSQEFQFPHWKIEKKIGNVYLYVKK